jgi:hypothetical protein
VTMPLPSAPRTPSGTPHPAEFCGHLQAVPIHMFIGIVSLKWPRRQQGRMLALLVGTGHRVVGVTATSSKELDILRPYTRI